uniref:Integrase catalytic domain-containing protein n=1 Tax=Salmo trutta TaxID=8032 RepID=A0A674CB77_SALTR
MDVKSHIQNCQVCQMYKPEGRKPAGKLQQTVVTRPWEMLGVDLMGPFPRSSNQNVYMLVFVDYYSKWVELFALRQATARTVSNILTKEILTRWGVPDYILSDRGSQFVSDLFEETCQRWNLRQKLTTAYHPQTNLTERVNRTLKTMVASYVGTQHKHWDKHLHEFRFALNSAVQESTGVTPAELNLSRPLRGPLEMVLQPQQVTPDAACYDQVVHLRDLRALVSKNMIQARLKQKRNYDKKRRDMQFQLRDRVWLRSHPYSKAEQFFSAKLAPKWQGPYRIVEQSGPLNYRVVKEDTGEDMRVVHVSRLKACYPSAEELEEIERRKVLEIFEEESEETFLGFPDPEVSRLKACDPSAEEHERQK